ncbi:MAG: signal peptidase I [Pantanalinema sp. GBBB05]|nr:signal peptidase I [Pantanalinema sp. GBBB05]
MQSHVITGNAAIDAAERRGWFVGEFITPTDDPRSTSALEVKWGIHVAGDRRAQWAGPSDSATLSVLISGRFWLQFPDREVLLADLGDYVLWLPEVSHSWWAEADSVVLTVRWVAESRERFNRSFNHGCELADNPEFGQNP